MSKSGPADLVPDDFDLTAAQNAESSTPAEKRKRCPTCNSADVTRVTGHPFAPTDVDHDYRCGQCCHKFDDPVRGER